MSFARRGGLYGKDVTKGETGLATSQGPTMSVRALSTSGDPNTIVFEIRGRIQPSDVDALCDDVCKHLGASSARRIVCDLGHALAADAVAVDALARLQLGARRLGRWVELRNASPALSELLDLMGLDEALPAGES